MLALLLLSAVGITPASANYFSNPQTGTQLNIGSAPNPTPEDLRAIGDVATVQHTDTYAYEQAAPPPAPPAPPPVAEERPAPPPPAMMAMNIPEQRQFTVFFDFGRSTLTPEARDIVGRAVDMAKNEGPVRIMVTGHTDTVGSKAFNQRLSERRAMSVKREMVRLGLNSNEIMTIGKGENDLLVPTGNNVREPQNRRAVIDLGTPPVASLDNRG
jgi:outer membrane protein OmpA-like peptidoglycan-associated protein